MSEDTDLELEGVFDLDSIEDLPGFVTPPTGAYSMIGKSIEEKEIESKDGGKKKYFQVNMTVKLPIEVDSKYLDEGEELPKEGDMVSMLFSKTQKGVAFMKPLLSPIAEHFNTKKSDEIFEHFKGLEMLIVFKRRWVQKVERHNLNIVKAAVT